MTIPARRRTSPRPGGRQERGLFRLTRKEYEALHALYGLFSARKNQEAHVSPKSAEGRHYASLYKKGYAVRANTISLNDGEEGLSYRISDDGVNRLLDPGLLLVETVMGE